MCCGQKASTVAARPGWDRINAVAHRLDRARRRLDRLALGAAARELLPRDVLRARPAAPVGDDRRRRSTPPDVRRSRADPGLGVLRGRVPRRARSPSASLAGPVDLGVGAVARVGRRAAPRPGVSTSLSPTEEAILWQIRVPRVILAALVGAMLALAGATYQGVFRNPLADPYLLGVAAGAGLGATIAIAYLPDGLRGQRMLPVAAFVGGVASP